MRRGRLRQPSAPLRPHRRASRGHRHLTLTTGYRMLLERILTALILTPLAVAIILFPPTWLFALIAAAVFLGAQWEWTRLCGVHRAGARRVMRLLRAIAMCLLWWQRAAPWLWPAVIATGLAWWLASLWWLRTYTFAASPTREHGWLKLVASVAVLVPAWVAVSGIHDLPANGRLDPAGPVRGVGGRH